MENITIDVLKKTLSVYMPKEYLDLIDKYYEEAKDIYEGMKRKTGEDYISHPLRVAYILADLKMDPITIGCSLIHEAITLNKRTYNEIKELFGEDTAIIVNSCTKLSGFKRRFKNKSIQDKYRRMVVGLSENPASLFIKVADRLDNLKTIYVHGEDHKKDIIDETMNIYIPIVHRLGIKKIKSELEDLCLKSSDPETYNQILEKINADRTELEDSLDRMKQEIIDLLKEHEINFEILSRVKSVRGIYNKLAAGKKWESIYDLLGLRVLVEKTEECYLVIGLIHSKYKSLPKRFKDYIANPKNNMYQSLHTTIFGVDGRIYEVQVRTYEMDEVAEKGVASHWSYKEKKSGSKDALAEKLENFKTLIKINDIENNLDFFKNVSTNLNKDEIYVFTPKGDIVELPQGATPVDFAYKIHSEIGNTVVSALVNNKIVKLSSPLSDGDIVQLITQNGKSPNKAWLKFVKTEQARSRIKSYFYKKERQKLIETGKILLESEVKKRKLNLNDVVTEENIKKNLSNLNVETLEELYLAVSTLKYNTTFIINKLINYEKEETFKEIKEVEKNNKNNIIVSGTSNILTSLASCCTPVYGDEIIGYVTKTNGISIHRKECNNIDKTNERIIDAEWSNQNDTKYNVALMMLIDGDDNHIADIISVATKHEIKIVSFTYKKTIKGFDKYEVICNVENVNILNNFVDALKQQRYINYIEREYRL